MRISYEDWHILTSNKKNLLGVFKKKKKTAGYYRWDLVQGPRTRTKGEIVKKNVLLIAGVFILKEPKIAENRKVFLENDEAQTQKLNQGHIIKKIGIFNRSLGNFFWFCRKIGKHFIFCVETWIFE